MDATIPSDADLTAALRNAKYAELASRACTDQAHSLVDYLMGLLTEAPQGACRGGAYKKTHRQRRRAVEGLLGDLLRTQKSEKAKGWVFRSLRAKSFTGEEIGHRAFTYVIDGLIRLGLLEHKPNVTYWVKNAFSEQSPDFARFRYASRFKATPKLLEESAHHGVAPADVY